MAESVELSRKLLYDVGGWKEMKEARAIHAAGRVAHASYQGGLIEADVREGAKTLHLRVEVRSRTDVVNHCPCYRARRDGLICAHALAAALEVIEPSSRADPEGGTRGDGGTRLSGSGHAAQTAQRPTLHPNWPIVTEQAEEGANFATLHFVVAPNFATAWDQGRITVGVEITREGKRGLLSALPPKTRLVLDPIDADLFRLLQDLSPETVPGILLVGKEDLSRLLGSVVGHPRLSLGRNTALEVDAASILLPLRWKGGLAFAALWPEDATPLVAATGSWAYDGRSRVQAVAPGLEYATDLLGRGLSVESANFPQLLREWSVYFDTSALDVRSSSPSIHLRLEGSLNHLDADLFFDYGGHEIPAGSDRPLVWEQDGALHMADADTERAAIADLESAGFVHRSGARYVNKDKGSILSFLAHGYPAFQRRWETQVGERFEHALGQVEPISTTMHFQSSGENWFSLELGFQTPSGDTFTRQEIQRLLESGRNSQPGAKGRIAVIEPHVAGDLAEILLDCDPHQAQPGVYQIDRIQADYLREAALDAGFRTDGLLPWQSHDGDTAPDFVPLPDALASTLRPYQREGVDWMLALAARGMGGILADDMGLGKTLQTLAFLQSVGGSALVVCPSSVVHNWIAEAEKFTPGRKAVAITGPNRERTLRDHADATIFVTSYALLRRDEAVWGAREFDAIILDEAQQIKNPEAQVSRAAHRLRGKYRFALTGTPVENSPEDLWSICRFAIPGYLGSRDRFAERFVKPLSTAEPSTAVRDRLARRLRPVVLRRLKREVARDLPEKIEQVISCELPAQQREVYTKLLRESQASLLEAQGGKKRMLALTALLRLRQACCDIRLLGLETGTESEESAKIEAITNLLDEAIAGGHRVLLFSQFVGMLQILAGELAQRRIAYEYLDGSTKDRAGAVRRFQNGNAPVFLISLRAGGVGLNLTAADTVIHVDPWWNPAVEAQATDRAHRIGQDRVVTSYKLIARDTVEEKILSLQNRKRALVESLLSETSSGGLSEDELMSLFE